MKQLIDKIERDMITYLNYTSLFCIIPYIIIGIIKWIIPNHNIIKYVIISNIWSICCFIIGYIIYRDRQEIMKELKKYIVIKQ